MRIPKVPHYSKFAFSTIRRKLLAIIIGVSAAALLLSGILIVLSQMATFRRSLASDLVLQARLVANNSLAAVSFDDPDDALLVLQTLESRTALVYGSISRADGRVLATYRREDFTDDPQLFESEALHNFDSNWLLARAPIVLDGEKIGSVFLQSDLSALRAIQRHVIITVLASLFVVFLVSLIISYRLQALISRPIERLTTVVRDISRSRDYTIRATENSKDEIGVLAKAFNEMLAELALHDAQLREREKRTQEYLNVAGVMIVALDAHGNVTLINPKGCALLGYSEKEILGKNWFTAFVPASMREKERQRFMGWMQDESETILHCESAILTTEGKPCLLSLHIRTIHNDAGAVIRLLLSGEDITDQRASEDREAMLRDQLARAERMKSIGVLAGGVAHDLNNMLGPLVALPELILEDIQSVMPEREDALASVEQSLDLMEKSALRASNVVGDLLAISRRGTYKRVPLDLSKLPFLDDNSVSMQEFKAAYPHVTFRVEVCSNPLTVLGSEDHLCRVLDNLLRNASDAIEGQGTVTISAADRHLYTMYEGYQMIPPGHYAVLEVSDTGVGMDAELRNRIFEPFYTKKQKTNRSGSGLGLSIVHGIMDDHEGYIDLASEPGVGTTFRLYFAQTDSVTEEGPESERALLYGTGQVLVVDDEPGQRYLASSCLTRLGYTVSLAENGHFALTMFERAKEHDQPSPYDLVVLDMIMEPDFDGLDTLRAITALYPEQKVLIVSGHAENARIAEALQLGAELLRKPYNMNDLAEAVARMTAGRSR